MLYHVLSCCILISVVGRFCVFFFIIVTQEIDWVGRFCVKKNVLKYFFKFVV